MKYYSYSGKKSQSRRKANKKRLIIRISIITAAVVLSVVFALALGNHLKKKLDDAPISTEPIEDLVTPDKNESESFDFKKNDHAPGETSALFGYLDLDGCPDAESAKAFVNNLHSAGFTGLIFNAKRADGKYSFASEEAYALARLEPSDSVVSPGIISSALGAAGDLGMRSAAYIDIAGALTPVGEDIGYELDRAVIRELCSLGFDEIVIDGAARGTLTFSAAKAIWNYISDIRTEFPDVDIGVVTDAASLRDAEASPTVEIMFRFVDFFAFDFTDRMIYGGSLLPDALADSARETESYNTLILVDGSDIGTMRSSSDALRSAGVERAAFLTPRLDVSEYADKLKPYSLASDTAADND